MTAPRKIRSIVIAWVTMDGSEPTGRRLGLYGERAELRKVPKASAVVWVNEGDDDDLAKARQHAATIDAELVHVFEFPTDYAKCLTDARETILRDHAARARFLAG